jgi:hypothetical protein
MKIYNKTTKELFGCISFIQPFNIFRFKHLDIRVKRMKKYCYLFPQKNYVWGWNAKRGHAYKEETNYWVFVWHITVTHTKKAS